MRDYTQPISEVTMVGALRRMGYTPQEMCIHGFRATARTLLDEVLRERYDLIEHQLAHTCATPMAAPITGRSILRNAAV